MIHSFDEKLNNSYITGISAGNHSCPLHVDTSVKGNRLVINEGVIELLPKPPGYVIGEYLHHAVSRVSGYVKDFFASFIPKTVVVEEIQNCKIAQERAIKAMSVCEDSLHYSNNESLGFRLQPKGTLETNLQIANEILLETLEVVRYSANNLARSEKILKELAVKQGIVLDDLTSLTHDAWDCIGSCRKEASLESRKQKGSLFTDGKMGVECAKHTHLGQCTEMSLVAFFKGMEKGIWNTHLDIVAIRGGDHVIVVYGREFGSDPLDYKTWGPSAVVIDAWAEKVFKLDEVETQLDDYSGVDPMTGKPALNRFNPQNQQLKAYIGNICSSHDLLQFKQSSICSDDDFICFRKPTLNDEQMHLYDEVAKELEQFHQVQDLQTKLVQANKLEKLCAEPHVQDFKIIVLLKDQINHFIELNK
jgi:hypothetical protein